MKDVKTYTQDEVEEYVRKMMTDREIALSKQADALKKSEEEIKTLNKELDVYKKKEKQLSRQLVLSERKANFMENETRSKCMIEVDRIARLVERWDDFFDELNSKYDNADKKKLDEFKNELSKTIDNMIEMGDIKNENLTDEQKVHASEIERLSVIKDKKESEIDKRFANLLKEFNMKIGDNASRGKGRPKKQDEIVVDEDVEGLTPDGSFDFDAALNPTDSLEQIMKDLLGE